MDADKIKDFFIFHVEKMILAVVIGVTVLLVWKGLQLPNFMDKHQPEKLTANATRVRGEIDDDHNDEIVPPRVPTFDILARANARQTPVDPTKYKKPNTWEGISADSLVQRRDPVLVPPRDLRAVGVLCSMAVRARDGTTYVIAGLETADPVEKVEQKAVRPPPRSRSRGRDRRSMSGEESSMDEMMEEMMEDYGSEEMDSEFGMSPGMVGGKRRLEAKYAFGARPGPTRDMKSDQPQTPVPEIAWFIAGTAVLPHKEMYEAYEAALKDAADTYDPRRRDTPAYFNFEVQRADVTQKSVDQLAADDWIPRFDRLFYTKRAALLWSGSAPELVPVDYRDEAITTWIPPVMLEDYTAFALHPLVPMKSKRDLEVENQPEIPMADPIGDLFGEEGEDETTVLAGPAGSSMRGTGMAPAEFSAMSRAGMQGAGIEVDPVDYKIMRFYDFVNPRDPNSPRPQRKYVYRLRVAVNDPNFPADPRLQPPSRSLDADSYRRVRGLMEKAEQEDKRSFQRWTEWSEPCQPVSLPNQEEYFAGPVTRTPPRIMRVNEKRVVKVMIKPPTAKIVASQFDFTYKARVPMLMEVTEGSVLSNKKEFNDVVDPITLEVKKIPNAEIISGTTVIGLDGGDPLTIVTADDMTEPGVMLLFDSNGGLSVTDDVSDQEYYRIYSFADERGE